MGCSFFREATMREASPNAKRDSREAIRASRHSSLVTPSPLLSSFAPSLVTRHSVTSSVELRSVTPSLRHSVTSSVELRSVTSSPRHLFRRALLHLAIQSLGHFFNPAFEDPRILKKLPNKKTDTSRYQFSCCCYSEKYSISIFWQFREALLLSLRLRYIRNSNPNRVLKYCHRYFEAMNQQLLDGNLVCR